MLEVTEQRPMNNEYANARVSKLSPVTLIAHVLISSTALCFGAQNVNIVPFTVPGLIKVSIAGIRCALLDPLGTGLSWNV